MDLWAGPWPRWRAVSALGAGPASPPGSPLTMLALLAFQALPILFAQLPGPATFPLPVFGVPFLTVRKAIWREVGRDRDRVRGAGEEVFGKASWAQAAPSHSPCGKSLLSGGSRSTSLPPESEEWEPWETPVPGGWE